MRKIYFSFFILTAIIIISSKDLACQNIYQANLIQPNLLEPPSISLATNSNNNQNTILWKLPEGTIFLSVGIYRESIQFSNKWDLISKTNANDYEYTDRSSDPYKQAYRYRVSGFDKCGIETSLSAPHRTINLRVFKTDPLSNLLIWNSYEGKNIETYNIYRGTNLEELKLIASVNNTQFNDTSTEIAKNKLYYRVSAQFVNVDSVISKNGFLQEMIWSNISAAPVITGENDTTFNNELKIFPNPSYTITTIFFPNPLSKNYEVSIYDLTGNQVYFSIINTSQVEIRIHNMKEGMYIIHVKGNKFYEGKMTVCNIF
jgi:hypothetical protein